MNRDNLQDKVCSRMVFVREILRPLDSVAVPKLNPGEPGFLEYFH
jgi:hypothetical protein